MVIRFFANFRDVAGARELNWNGPVSTLDALIDGLCTQYGEPFQSILFKGDTLAPWIIILVNGQDYRHIKRPVLLNADDTVCFFPPVAGG